MNTLYHRLELMFFIDKILISVHVIFLQDLSSDFSNFLLFRFILDLHEFCDDLVSLTEIIPRQNLFPFHIWEAMLLRSSSNLSFKLFCWSHCLQLPLFLLLIFFDQLISIFSDFRVVS